MHKPTPSHGDSPGFADCGQACTQSNAHFLNASLRAVLDKEENQTPLMSGVTTDPVMAALGIFATWYNLPLAGGAQDVPQTGTPVVRIRHIMEANHWRVRQVRLAPDVHRWHTQCLLGFQKADGQPVIVCPCGEQSYCIDPVSGQRTPLDAERVAEIEPKALCVYEPLPMRPLTWKETAAFVLRGSGALWSNVICVGSLCGLLALLQPLATEYVIGTLIPTANNAGLWQLLILLMVLTCSQALLQAAPNLRLSAFSSQCSERLNAAMFDRLFRLPIKFFRKFDSGDLGTRIMSISALQKNIISLLTKQLMTVIFSFFSLCMLLYYSWELSLAGLMLTFVYSILSLLLLRSTLPHLAKAAHGGGHMVSFLKQVFDGIATIKLCGAEQRVLHRFLGTFLTVSKANYSVQLRHDRLDIMGMVFTCAVSLLFYWLVGDTWRGSLSMAQYMAFMAAFTGFQRGVLSLCEGLWILWRMEPELQRLRPILEEATEQPSGLTDPGILDGNVEISRVTFRYEAHLPPTLVDVSLEAKAGECIAVVGPSGAGKSSLLRLLVGFEQPESGGIFYNGKNLNGLNLHAVRRQLGCILQGSRIMPSTILDNIVGGTQFTLDDAMEAARLANLKQDIEAMPMGIHTLVGEGLLSGGQMQRLLLARALVGSPPILLLDEATSALDNVTQHRVWTNLENLRATRIVIAHRLSTIVNADRIYVLSQGRVCETGTYTELMRRDGVFKKLAQRQLL